MHTMTAQHTGPREARPVEKYLIGPQTYAAFEWTLRWSLLLLAAGYAVWFALPVVYFIMRSGVGSPESGAAVNLFTTQLVNVIVTQCVLGTIEFVRAALSTMGVLVVVFGVMDRFSSASSQPAGIRTGSEQAQQDADSTASGKESLEEGR